MGYSLPMYHETAKSYVDFYCVDRRDGKIHRKKYHLDGIKTKKERREMARQLIAKLTVKLSQGWQPWDDERQSERGYATIEACLDKYIDRIEKFGRKKTIQTYKTGANKLREYFATLPNPPKYVIDLNREKVTDFLDWLIEEQDVSARTRNNYRGWLCGFCAYLMERKYLAENPVIGVERIRESRKIRKSLTPEMLSTLFRFLKENDPHFLLAVMMEYYTFIRPNELSQLRINDISIKEQRIFVAGEVSKNRRDCYVALNETVIRQMIDNGLFDYPGEFHIFGPDFIPSATAGPYNMFNRRWSQIRTAMKWGSQYQFYSLKDSGIRDLANTAGIVIARDQARHTDISTTNKYLEGLDGRVAEEAKHFKGNIG